jgi:hypothetical protein
MAGDVPRLWATNGTPPARPPAGNFTVLLGTDYAGKSTILSELAVDGWQCVSYDDEFVPPGCELITELRESFVPRALHGVGDPYSTDFVLTLLQTSVVYIRDQALRADPARPAIVDSYYYKMLGKCVLTGLVNEAIIAWWRSFPRPRRVIFLDVDPTTAWQRSEWGARLNAFEYYGETPTWEGFRQFQLDLRELLLREVGALPMNILPQTDDPQTSINAIRSLVRSDDVLFRAA